MFSRKSNKPAFDLDLALLRVLDDARGAGCSARRIAEADEGMTIVNAIRREREQANKTADK